ncbi:MAG: NUDIX hydrolase [Gammaproteobacteria bacterium]|nr:NUDIX hydrolase [Gammaproteobacteria bacterium]
MSEDSSLLHAGSLISLYKEKVAFPDGGHTYFDIVKHPGGAVIAALNEKDEICLLRQWRHAVDRYIWELPAGCLEAGEAPLITAQRELEEEAGVTATRWTELGQICTSPGFSNEILYFFTAQELQPGTAQLDDAEQLEVHWMPLSRVADMARSDELIDAKSLALLYRLSL